MIYLKSFMIGAALTLASGIGYLLISSATTFTITTLLMASWVLAPFQSL